MKNRENDITAGRAWSLEYLRILAAFGIVLFHCEAVPLSWLGLSGLWVFLLISFTLTARAAPAQPLAAFAAAKMRRVMVPWLFWSALYLAFGLWRHGTQFYEEWMLLTGFSMHLWYLPYLFCASVALHWARRSSPALDGTAGILLAAAFGLVLLAANGLWHSDTPPFAQWLTALPVTLLGFALGRIALAPETRPRRVAATALVVCVIAVCVARLFIPGRQGLDAVTVLVGVGAFIIAQALPLPSSAVVRLLSPLTLGIYLIHPLIMDILVRVIGQSGSLLRVVMVFAVSAVVVYGMKKVPVLRGTV